MVALFRAKTDMQMTNGKRRNLRRGLVWLVVFLFWQVACQSKPVLPTPTLLPTPVPPTAAPTLSPTQTPKPLPDLPVTLDNNLGADWRRGEIRWSPDSRFVAATFWAGNSAQTYLVDSRTGDWHATRWPR